MHVSIIQFRYTLCLSFARLLLFSPALIPVEHQRQITDLAFLSEPTTTAKAINALEERYQYNWTTVAPFVEMLYAPFVMQCQSEPEAQLSVQCRTWGVGVALLALRTEMRRALLRRLAREEGVVDFVAMLPWSMPARWRDECSAVVKLFTADGHLPVPRLCSIARAVLARSGSTIGLRQL